MAERDRDNSTGRTVAVLGGGALLVFLLLRGKGWGLGLGGTAGASGDGHAGEAPASTEAPPSRCKVRVDSTGLQLDRAPTELDAIVTRCRAAGAADVLVTGAAIQGVVDRLLQALRDAGVVVHVLDPSGAGVVTR